MTWCARRTVRGVFAADTNELAAERPGDKEKGSCIRVIFSYVLHTHICGAVFVCLCMYRLHFNSAKHACKQVPGNTRQTPTRGSKYTLVCARVANVMRVQ